ncbi:MAG: hypothetical protein LUE21_10440, partial [Oscillospiraceae bacterium]|nr:hypothetical protein [Oscillospiraceae bacterium]
MRVQSAFSIFIILNSNAIVNVLFVLLVRLLPDVVVPADWVRPDIGFIDAGVLSIIYLCRSEIIRKAQAPAKNLPRPFTNFPEFDTMLSLKLVTLTVKTGR